MAKKKCQHNVKLISVFNKPECIECVLIRLGPPLGDLVRLLAETDLDSGLRTIKRNFNLTERDIILLGWVWGEWRSRNGF